MNNSSSKLLTSEVGLTTPGLEKSGKSPSLTSVLFPGGFCCARKEWLGGLRPLRNASAAVRVACAPSRRFGAFCAPGKAQTRRMQTENLCSICLNNDRGLVDGDLPVVYA